MEQSIIRDIFGGVFKNEITVDQTWVEKNKKVDVMYEPFYVLNLEIPRNCYTLEQCLGAYFQKRILRDYKVQGHNCNATHQQLMSKLPNVLCIHLKRFIWTDRLIKMKDFISFETVLKIQKEWLSGQTGTGDTGKEYRLFSVVEHVGEFAHRGHYINYALDSDDEWQKFDD